MPGFNGPPLKYPIDRVQAQVPGGHIVYYCGHAKLGPVEAMPLFVRPIIEWCDQHHVPLKSQAVTSLDSGVYWRFTFGLNDEPGDDWYVINPEGVNDLIDRLDWAGIYYRLGTRAFDKTPIAMPDHYGDW